LTLNLRERIRHLLANSSIAIRDCTIEAEPGLPIATERDASRQKHELELMRRERGLKKCMLELEREELQRKRREPEFEEELEAKRAGEQLEVRGDDGGVVFVFESRL
jgi:hypothetical protein